MLVNSLLEKTVTALGHIAESGSKSGSGRMDLGRGILDVAMMISALDGEILPAEREAAGLIAGLFSDVSDDGRKAAVDQAMENAELVLAERKGGASDKQLVGFLILRAVLVLPAGFAGRPVADVRFALVLWLAMCLSDGSFDSAERLAFWRLLDCFIPRPENVQSGSVRPTAEQLACRDELEKFVKGLSETDSAASEKEFAELLSRQ